MGIDDPNALENFSQQDIAMRHGRLQNDRRRLGEASDSVLQIGHRLHIESPAGWSNCRGAVRPTDARSDRPNGVLWLSIARLG